MLAVTIGEYIRINLASSEMPMLNQLVAEPTRKGTHGGRDELLTPRELCLGRGPKPKCRMAAVTPMQHEKRPSCSSFTRYGSYFLLSRSFSPTPHKGL